jgi:hypothetical protein
MTDASAVNIGENSSEHVAYRLMHDIANAEGKIFNINNPEAVPSRHWILSTYAECLLSVRDPYNHPPRGR